MTIVDLEWYAVRHLGLAAQSIERLSPALLRWRRRLLDLGFDEVPRYPFEGWAPSRMAQFENLLALWLKQVADNEPAGAHHLRNLTHTRPFKL